MPETAIADGSGHANLLRQRHLQTPPAFASSESDAIVRQRHSSRPQAHPGGTGWHLEGGDGQQ